MDERPKSGPIVLGCIVVVVLVALLFVLGALVPAFVDYTLQVF